PGAGQTQQWSGEDSGNGGAASVKPGGIPSTQMSWTLTTSTTWKLAAVPLSPADATEVRATSVTVTHQADRTRTELTTGREVSSLGFNLYREENGQRVRLNSSLLAGTALVAGSGTNPTTGHVHTLWDAPPGDNRGVSYWVEEIDVHGQRTW